MSSSEWERQTGHVAFVCRCTRNNCQFCDGGLTTCVTCGGFEGSLLPYCPGRKLSQHEDSLNYIHYCDRTGPFAQATVETVNEAKWTCYHRLYPHSGSARGDKHDLIESSPGARALFEAVSELFNDVYSRKFPHGNY